MQPDEQIKMIHLAASDERKQCVRELEQFAREYVQKWIGTQGESIKAEAWAILQAAEHLRSGLGA